MTSYETRLAGLIVAWEQAPPETRLKRRLDKAKEDAESHGFAAQKSLVNFAKAAEEAIKDGKLEAAENYINSYEVKLAEWKINPPKAAPQATPVEQTTTTPPQPATPAVDPKTVLIDRLKEAKAKAEASGHADDKALGKFAAKAEELLGKGDLDGAEGMVHSYETRQGELAAKPHVEPVAQAEPTVESLRRRLADAQARVASNSVTPGKALNAFAEKAEEYLAAGDLKRAEDMILSFETRLSELLAHGQA